MSKLSIAVFFLTCSAAIYAQETKNDSVKTEKRIEGVTIQGSVKKSSESNIISIQRKSVEVIERVGTDQLEKQGVGDVSVAVTKATGAQKQEGSGQVFIRGLGDRSNATTMNGLPIPSNDPIYKNIDLSIIKTDMIDYVGLEKVYNPKMWGDMSGANVDIVSKVYTGKPYFKVNLGSSVNSNAINQNNFYLQNGPDYFGFKQINKPSNAALVNNGYVFKTSWADREVFTPINSSLGIDFGRTFKIGEQGKLSVFGFGSFDNNYGYQEGITRSVDNVGIAMKDLFGTEYSYATNSTGLINLNYKLNSNHNLKFVSNYIHTTEQKLENYSGYIRDTNENRADETALLRRANYKTNDLFINQLSGEHKISSPLKLYWNLGFNRLDSRRPDRMQNISIYNQRTDSNYFGASNPGANHRYFDKLIENDYVGDIHADYEINENVKLTFGYNGRYKESDFRATQFNFRINTSQGNYYLNPGDYGSFFNATNYAAGLFDIVTFRGDIKWNPETALVPQFYNSEVLNNAGYANLDYKFSDRFTAQVGLRYDNLDQKIEYSTSIKDGTVEKNYSKILPALNLKYSVNDTNNLRFSASKTYTTPLLLEVAPYEYEEVDELSFGNPALYPSDNYNADLKWEWFPKRGEVISVTAFGKYIQNPISRVTVNSSSNSVSFVNIGDKGHVFGVEMEFRKDLYQNNNTRIYTFLNGTYLNTNQELDREKVVAETTTSYSNTISIDPSTSSDKMQGASDFLANVNLGFEQKWGSQNALDLVVSYSHISDNIYSIGYASKGNLVDKAINVLDAVAKVKFANGIGFSVSGKNLLNPSFKRVQENSNGDVSVRDYKKGTNIGVGVSYEF
ncbi:TonB-dependent receptor [Kaistella haifensis]|nr:TonB-dependent receptor [Kaistella haifensis]